MIERVKGVLRFRLVRNILALYGVRAVDQLLPIVVIPFLARVLGADGWGLVASAQALAIYGIITVEYGFELAGTRAVARDRANGARLTELISGIFATQLILACAVALAAILVRLTVPEFQNQPLLLWAALAFAILQGLYPLWFFVGQERIPLIATIGVGAKVLATIAIFVFVRGPGDGWIVLAAYAGAALLASAAGYALMLRQVRPGRLDLELISHTLRLGFSMFVMRISVLMHTAGNSFLLLLLGGPIQVAFFAAGEKLCRPAAWLMHPINVALLPRLSHLVEHSPDQARAMATLSILLMTAVGIAFGVAIGLLAPWLVDLLFGLPEYQPAVAVLRIMALIIPLIVLNAALVSQWLVPHGLDRALLLVVISGTVLNLILALIFAGRFGGIGMAWITVTVEAYILIGLLWALHRHGLRPIAPQLLPGLLRELATQVARRS
ncbi:MAG: polysaccharide biosynthesis protein [Geminicoccaceae bacterium]|jgi:PST family polysaccharide transporter|nr:polysaccharide biosynthesis protein [Geminicoccaceae bacterium]MCE3249425.1 polysaccharide biosynthesis protein [Geminicoccaceae bacterium]